MSELVQASFDYGMLDEARRVRVQVRAESIRARMKRTAEDIIAIGQDLLEAKKDLGHGQFLAWLKDEFEMSEPQAQRFMQVARRFGGETKSIKMMDFPPTILYALAAPSTPDAVIEQVQAGEIPATLEAIKAAKEAQRQAEEQVSKIEQESLLALMLANDRVTDAQASARLLEEQVEVKRSEIAQLTKHIADLEQELASPQIITQEVTKEVIPPETQKKLADMERKLTEAAILEKNLKAEKDEKAAQLKQKSERLKMLYEEMSRHTAITEQQKHIEEIRFKWRQCCDAFHLGINQAFARLVTPLDAKVAFEADDWARLAEIESTLRQALEHLGQLRVSVTSQFIDTSMEYVEA